MKNYVYRNLRRYGNCYISEKTYKRLGENRILNDLKEHGFDCNINIIKDKNTEYNGRFELVTTDEKDIILEVIGGKSVQGKNI